jgi:hypothetical protein
MSGTRRLPGGQPRKASQRNSRRAQPAAVQFRISWRPGDNVKWQGRAGTFRRDVGDGEHSEIVIGERVYRVRTGEIG